MRDDISKNPARAYGKLSDPSYAFPAQRLEEGMHGQVVEHLSRDFFPSRIKRRSEAMTYASPCSFDRGARREAGRGVSSFRSWATTLSCHGWDMRTRGGLIRRHPTTRAKQLCSQLSERLA